MFDGSFFSRPLTTSPTKSQPQTTFLKSNSQPWSGDGLENMVGCGSAMCDRRQPKSARHRESFPVAALPPFVSWYSPHYPNNISRPASLSSVDSRRLTWLEACRLRAIDAPLLRSE
ncbi:hypothetical protein Bbelb_150880 [Branchiostoma belcheri]|nr:hypothetical protein Bbelb_150880 [Branchiostoma belcheri]